MSTILKTDEYIFSSESVSSGHPDKICDRISDAVLDLFMQDDPDSRSAVETLATTNLVVLAGEVRGNVSQEQMIQAARDTVKAIGYEQDGFHWQKMEVICRVHEQSHEIAAGVDSGANKELGAGDQGMMFGFACDETPDLMPAAIYYSHKILRELDQYRVQNPDCGLGLDAKAQTALIYQGYQPKKMSSLVLSHQHDKSLSLASLKDLLAERIKHSLPEHLQPQEVFFNPAGDFIIGGPDGDAGLTGRKIIVDTYGGAAPHGGGAFSGKDSTKVDRSAAYIGRYIAKNIVAAGLAKRCCIQISYAIGYPKPLSVAIDHYGTGTVPVNALSEEIQSIVDLSPQGIRDHLKLMAPIYTPTSSYGHFGRTPTKEGHFTWERIDELAPKLRSIFAEHVIAD